MAKEDNDLQLLIILENKKHRVTKHLDSDVNEVAVVNEDALDKVSYEEILGSIQQLTPGYTEQFLIFLLLKDLVMKKSLNISEFQLAHRSRTLRGEEDNCKGYYFRKIKYKFQKR
jgi:hypothetical protein